MSIPAGEPVIETIVLEISILIQDPKELHKATSEIITGIFKTAGGSPIYVVRGITTVENAG